MSGHTADSARSPGTDPVAVTATVTGRRWWAVTYDQTTGELVGWPTSPLRGDRWVDGSLRATCNAGRFLPAGARAWFRAADGPVPHVDPGAGFPMLACGALCGIHLSADPVTLIRFISTNPPVGDGPVVLGEAAGWGRVVEHHRGWRCARAGQMTVLIPGAGIRRELRGRELPGGVLDRAVDMIGSWARETGLAVRADRRHGEAWVVAHRLAVLSLCAAATGGDRPWVGHRLWVAGVTRRIRRRRRTPPGT